MIWLLTHHPLLPSVRKTEKGRQLADERMGGGVGEEPNHTIARKPSPLYLIQYSLTGTDIIDMWGGEEGEGEGREVLIIPLQRKRCLPSVGVSPI
jgi:hypothetical protein